jgi:hypothetical protein
MRISKTRANRYRAECLRAARRAAARRDLDGVEHAFRDAERYAPVSEQTKKSIRKIARGEGKARPYVCTLYDEHGHYLYHTTADLTSREEGSRVLFDAFVKATGRKIGLDWRFTVVGPTR